MATIEMQPPRVVVSPLQWVRKNLFNSWGNILLTILTVWLLVTVVSSAANWALNEARWGVIRTNLTLFMVGQYPRDQLWRLWLAIYLLAGLLGLSWGVWKKAARGFAFIALGAGAVFTILSLLQGWSVWLNWLFAIGILAGSVWIGRNLPHGETATLAGWFLYFPLVLLLIAG